MAGLINDFVKEEILYREALGLGLDQGDTIIRRRLGQKLEFLSKDLNVQPEPSEEELQTFLKENTEQFMIPARITFSHIYLNADHRGDSVDKDAEELLATIRSQSSPVDLATVGDRFMLQNEYVDYSQREISRLFGGSFAESLFSLEQGSWQGPIFSGYGLHLVFIKGKTEARLPSLEEVREQVKLEYVSVKERQANEAFYQKLRDQYEVVIEPKPAAQPASKASEESK
jgi:parvulin-like peptidyl-prolyl isomerase